MLLDDTIAAISTAVGEGAIAVLRISGPDAVDSVARIFRGTTAPEKMEARRSYFGEIYDATGVIDQVLVTIFRCPQSYTGEDLVEISCHGGILVTRKILSLLLTAGARSAEPGEFTQRAFLNGKMDLTQAEAVMDLIRAQTELALRAANEQLAGHLGRELTKIQDELLTTLAHIEAYIDFPDEGISPETGKMLFDRLKETGASLDRLIATADQGRILRHGLRTVIYGEPNVGKSSLLNLLLGYDRAIVSETPGTTRDTIEETINIRGIPVRLIDTAGKRSSADSIEQEGIRRTELQLAQADLVLRVVDASLPSRSDDEGQSGDLSREAAGSPDEAAKAFDHRAKVGASEGTANSENGRKQSISGSGKNNRILILNKVDLGIHPDWESGAGVRFSCRTREGEEALNQAIWDFVMTGGLSGQDFRIAISVRHQACLQKAITELEAAKAGLAKNELPELISIDLRGALDAIGDVVGRHDTEDLLGRIFSEFCIGK
ncbi:MAG: tRNA uridine-5-carboxymethylaminomethyl(34) synthesis GTPase MnmE [Verrucomicrobia bacterium]|nr:tRNA uridine-5-carboxymethylaminomethyl(34) synthesis GTPase MnmE [Verrucomicrobiota bacterium]